MTLKILLTSLLLCASAFAEAKFEVKNASKSYDVLIEVERCENKICEGKVSFTVFKKGARVPFQVFRLDDTSFMLGDNDEPSVNVTRLDRKSTCLNSSHTDIS